MGLYPKQVTEYLALEGIPRGPNSKIFVVDPVHGDDDNAGDRWSQPLATVAAALALCTTAHHDVVLVIASPTAVTETEAIAWDKNETHLIGMGTPTRYGKRTRIISGADDLSPWITISGSGCMFKNLRLVHEQASDAHSLVCVQLSGERNYFENVEFCGNVAAAQAIDAGASLQIAAGGSENLFKHCTFGMDTVAGATGLMAMVINASAGAARNRWEDCIFQGYAGSTAAGLIEFMNATALDRAWVFKNCEFVNLGTSTMASVFVFTGGTDAASKRVLLMNCWKIGATDWDHGNTGLVYMDMPISTGVQGATDSGQLIVTSG
jgi:hypothetical protein